MANLKKPTTVDPPDRSKYDIYRQDTLDNPGEWILVATGRVQDRDMVKSMAQVAAGSEMRRTTTRYGNGFEASTRNMGDDPDEKVWGMIRWVSREEWNQGSGG